MNRRKSTAGSVLAAKRPLRALGAGRQPSFVGGLLLACWLFCGAPSAAWEIPKTSRLTGQPSQATVLSGDTLYEVARRNGYALEHLAEANGLPVSLELLSTSKVSLPSRRILPSDPPKHGVVVNLPERGFYLFDGDATPRFFPIAVGEPGRFATPTGSFSIVEKVENPDWVAPEWAGLGEDNVVPAGPDNPLGDRWIGLSSPGLGMHSTNNPSSIGSATSHGCMRMYPELARVAFDLVKTGWPARIEYVLGRAALEREGIFVSGFRDVYSRGGGAAQVRQDFAKDDLLGFYRSESVDDVLRKSAGVPVKVVDLSPKAWYGPKWFFAARIQGELYVEQGLLEEAGAKLEFSLADRRVKLSRDNRTKSFPLYIASSADPTEGEAFLSRGSGWFPARAALEGLGLTLSWEGAQKRLRVSP